MFYLLDTNAVSDLLYLQPQMRVRVAAAFPGNVVITSIIVQGEILFGIRRLPAGRRRDELETRALGVFALAPPHPLPADAAARFGDIKASCEQKGFALGDNDLWIATTAFSLDATVVTRDADFAQIAGLRVEDWTR